ncbi:MAG: division/cell wall cluster transcriptional repressor MraZ [candidate division NC10 bacterium]|nr:division/cell wall cluster transcriptional repressor MraZ [candidate division NC10 bacterium]
MFRGRYEHTLDEKGRLSLPAKFREALAERGENELILTDFDTCLAAYPLSEWRLLEEKIRAHSTLQKDVRAFLRLFYSGAIESTLDAQGRILIPRELRERAELRKEVVVVGVLNKIEIWSKARWKRFISESAPAFEEIAAKLAELGI